MVPRLAHILGVAALAGCAPVDLDATRAAVPRSSGPAEAVALIDAALAGGVPADADPDVVWDLERARLEALADLGDAMVVVQDLARLRDEWPERADLAFHAAIARRLSDADLGGAIDVYRLTEYTFGHDERLDELSGMLVERGSARFLGR